MPAVDDWVTQWQPQDVHPASELVEQLLLLTTHAGLREPDAQDKAADVIKAVEALAIGDETFPDVIVRLVNDLESDSTVRKADANVFIASLNIEGDGTGSRQKRSAAVSGGLSDRQLGRNARKVAGALVRRYLASDPAPVPAGVPTRLVELEASLRVPGRFLNPTQVLERRVVEPSHEEMSEWRASIAASLWGDPHFTHFGRGHFEELPGDPGMSALRIRFNPPSRNRESFSLLRTFDNPEDRAIYGHYDYTFLSQPDEFAVRVMLGARPTAAYWLECLRPADWPRLPASVREIEIQESGGGSFLIEERIRPPVNRRVGIVWFWIPSKLDEGVLSWDVPAVDPDNAATPSTFLDKAR